MCRKLKGGRPRREEGMGAGRLLACAGSQLLEDRLQALDLFAVAGEVALPQQLLRPSVMVISPGRQDFEGAVSLNRRCSCCWPRPDRRSARPAKDPGKGGVQILLHGDLVPVGHDDPLQLGERPLLGRKVEGLDVE